MRWNGHVARMGERRGVHRVLVGRSEGKKPIGRLYIYIYIYIYIYTWVRALWIEFNNYPTRCDLFSLLYFCRQLYMFRVLTPIIRSWYSCNYSFWYWLTGSNTIRFRCWVGTDSCVSYCRYDTHESVPTVRYTWISTYRTIHMNQFQLNNESGW